MTKTLTYVSGVSPGNYVTGSLPIHLRKPFWNINTSISEKMKYQKYFSQVHLFYWNGIGNPYNGGHC